MTIGALLVFSFNIHRYTLLFLLTWKILAHSFLFSFKYFKKQYTPSFSWNNFIKYYDLLLHSNLKIYLIVQ